MWLSPWQHTEREGGREEEGSSAVKRKMGEGMKNRLFNRLHGKLPLKKKDTRCCHCIGVGLVFELKKVSEHGSS